MILGAFLSVGSFLAFNQDTSLKSQDSCGTAHAIQPICGQTYVSNEKLYGLVVVGVSATVVGFFVETRVDRML